MISNYGADTAKNLENSCLTANYGDVKVNGPMHAHNM
jgi:hypothetical protein